jgi:hypothetical protein
MALRKNESGPFMEKHRAEFFLATKTGERTYQKARDEIHRSLERLRVEQVDLLQLHCLVDLQEWETALGPGGALEAAIEAREAGLVRFIGVTGHGLPVAERHVMSLQRFDFDSVLLPWSYIMMKNTQYAADFAALRQLCGERGIAMQTIKAVSRRPWGEQTHSHSTWYQPIEEQGALDKAAHWVLGHSDLFLNSVGDIHILPLLLDAASRFEQCPSTLKCSKSLSSRRWNQSSREIFYLRTQSNEPLRVLGAARCFVAGRKALQSTMHYSCVAPLKAGRRCRVAKMPRRDWNVTLMSCSTLKLGKAAKRYCCAMVATAIGMVIIAKPLPMHWRGPPPKGK